MGHFESTKLFDGFSTVFRQWRAEGTHCQFLHGYSVSFKFWFEGELDEKNWVWDFGGMSRTTGLIDGMPVKEWFHYMFDHTLLVSEDDPLLETFLKLEQAGAVQVRVVPATGAERFAQYLYDKVNAFVVKESQGRVRVRKVEFSEHSKNSATYTVEMKSKK